LSKIPAPLHDNNVRKDYHVQEREATPQKKRWTVGDGGWVDLPEPIIVRASEAFIVVPGLELKQDR
jgi:hypothetical protein